MAWVNGGMPLTDNQLARLIRDSAQHAWHAGIGAVSRVEYAFAQRVSAALNGLQIPTARDVRELNARIEALQQAVLKLERRAARAAAPAHRAGPGPGPRKAAKGARVRTSSRKRNASGA